MHYALAGVLHYAYKNMELRAYLDSKPRGNMVVFAGRLGISPIYLSQLAARQDERVPSAELCVRIEQATDAAVTRRDLRPDDWQAIWPELVIHSRAA